MRSMLAMAWRASRSPLGSSERRGPAAAVPAMRREENLIVGVRRRGEGVSLAMGSRGDGEETRVALSFNFVVHWGGETQLSRISPRAAALSLIYILHIPLRYYLAHHLAAGPTGASTTSLSPHDRLLGD